MNYGENKNYLCGHVCQILSSLRATYCQSPLLQGTALCGLLTFRHSLELFSSEAYYLLGKFFFTCNCPLCGQLKALRSKS